MKFIYTFLLLALTTMITAQNPKGFDEMCQQYIQKTVPLVQPQELYKISNEKKVYILDAREPNEYKTSHIKGAIAVGYDHFSTDKIKHLDKSKPVYIYCSIGYRSEKIGEKLIAEGFKNVYNLYGGIFYWANLGLPLEDSTNKRTTKVHGYNNDWSKWLNTTKCTPALN